jgi:hypothetical protein
MKIKRKDGIFIGQCWIRKDGKVAIISDVGFSKVTFKMVTSTGKQQRWHSLISSFITKYDVEGAKR